MVVKKNVPETAYLPDIRLAQLFNFTAADLAANRSGFVSWGQRWNLGRYGQRSWGWLMPHLPRWLALRSAERVEMVCGRIRLQHQVREVFMVRQVRMIETFTLEFVHHGHHFALTRDQYAALHDGVVYRVYHQEMSLLTLERVADGCGE